MLQTGKTYNLWFKIIAAIIIKAFLVMDIAYAAGGDLRWINEPKTTKSHLAPTVQITSKLTSESFSLIYSMVDGYNAYLKLKSEEGLSDSEAIQKVTKFLQRITDPNRNFIFISNKGNTDDVGIKGAILTRINGQYICVYSEAPDFIKQDVIEDKIPTGTITGKEKPLHWSIVDSNKVAKELGFAEEETQTTAVAAGEQQVTLKPRGRITLALSAVIDSLRNIFSMAMPQQLANQVGSKKLSLIMAVAALGISVILIPFIPSTVLAASAVGVSNFIGNLSLSQFASMLLPVATLSIWIAKRPQAQAITFDQAQNAVPRKIKFATKRQEQSRRERRQIVTRMVGLVAFTVTAGIAIYLFGPFISLFVAKIPYISVVSAPILKIFGIVLEVILPLAAVIGVGQIIRQKLFSPRERVMDIEGAESIPYIERWGIKTAIGIKAKKRVQSYWTIILTGFFASESRAKDMLIERIANQYQLQVDDIKAMIQDAGINFEEVGLTELVKWFKTLQKQNSLAKKQQDTLLNSQGVLTKLYMVPFRPIYKLWSLLYSFAIYAVAEPIGAKIYGQRDFLGARFEDVFQLILKEDSQRIKALKEKGQLRQKVGQWMFRGRFSFILDSLIDSAIFLPFTAGLRLIGDRLSLVLYSSVSRGIMTALITYLVSPFASGSTAIGAGKILGFSFVSSGAPVISVIVVAAIGLRFIFKARWFKRLSLPVRVAVIGSLGVFMIAGVSYALPALLSLSLPTSFGVLKIGSAITHFFSIQNLLGAYFLGLLRLVPQYYKAHKAENIARDEVFTKGLNMQVVNRLDAANIISFLSSLQISSLSQEQILEIVVTLRADMENDVITYAKDGLLSPKLARTKLNQEIARLEGMLSMEKEKVDSAVEELIKEQKASKTAAEKKSRRTIFTRGMAVSGIEVDAKTGERKTVTKRVSIFSKAVESGFHIALVSPEIALLLNGSLALDSAFSTLLGTKVSLIHDFVSLIESNHGVIGAGSAVLNEALSPLGGALSHLGIAPELAHPDNLIFRTFTYPLLGDMNINMHDLMQVSALNKELNSYVERQKAEMKVFEHMQSINPKDTTITLSEGERKVLINVVENQLAQVERMIEIQHGKAAEDYFQALKIRKPYLLNIKISSLKCWQVMLPNS